MHIDFSQLNSQLNHKGAALAASITLLAIVPVAALASPAHVQVAKQPVDGPQLTLTPPDAKKSSNSAVITTASAPVNFAGIPVENPQKIALPAGSISSDQAMQAAADVYPDKAISKTIISQSSGEVVFSVRFTDGARVNVRATDGAVLDSAEAPPPVQIAVAPSSPSGPSQSGNSGNDYRAIYEQVKEQIKSRKHRKDD